MKKKMTDALIDELQRCYTSIVVIKTILDMEQENPKNREIATFSADNIKELLTIYMKEN